MLKNVIFNGHSLDVLKNIPNNSVDMVITSPPYFAMRNYETTSRLWDNDPNCDHEWINIRMICTGGKGHKQDTNKGGWYERNVSYCKKCAAFGGELGLEPFFGDKTVEIEGKKITFRGYISHLVDIFDEVKRVLKPTGIFFLNIGDTYYGGGKNEGSTKESNDRNKQGSNKGSFKEIGGSLFKNKELPDKCLCMIPQRIAIEMIDRGWILRNNICWYKCNSFPNPAKDRFGMDWENIFVFSKKNRYYFKQQFEDCANVEKRDSFFEEESQEGNKRIKRSVWNIPIKGFSAKKVGITNADHFAAFPNKLVETPIKAGCPEFVCKKCGKPKEMDCECNAGFEPGIVLDIFMGTGTTAVVSSLLGRNWIGIEINPEYCNIIKRRLEVEARIYNVKIYDKDVEETKDTRSCNDCTVNDCMLKVFNEPCHKWISK